MALQYYEGIGRRKSSTARVRVMSGKGLFIVNEKPVEDYFPRLGDMEQINAVWESVQLAGEAYDVTVKVSGGGVSGQTGAVELGLARALVKMNPEMISSLRRGGHLTRDPRVKERKKPGLKRARKAPTYTKR
ncbi:MAG TPA: 30S ribosomal protein S9 [Chloroflexi bacterium]|jgi:small subunit ribosomal protein S9|nr:30S ribosomal protein S9 [Chloroflexota bacterium]